MWPVQNSEDDCEEGLFMETETTKRTVGQVLTQAAAGAAGGLLTGIVLLAIYRWLWHVEISSEDWLFLSLGFSLYCGVLATWFGKRFWNLLMTFLGGISS